jgi:hypothetical protein
MFPVSLLSPLPTNNQWNNLYQILTTNKKGGISTIEKKKVLKLTK